MFHVKQNKKRPSHLFLVKQNKKRPSYLFHVKQNKNRPSLKNKEGGNKLQFFFGKAKKVKFSFFSRLLPLTTSSSRNRGRM